ncbi:ABC-type xylose transport system substrate-binding protein [Brevundimonas variabilis]|uniref:ABC-type xylose transport system substrate-binding protein n=1 Tax=Brevundimonas variabilis TaxID=74312 RepID=A0A7W9CGQ8_9CAUL|nr:ABC-type xylose transport system substrate-binding protein [Brevundimonas variabilis]
MARAQYDQMVQITGSDENGWSWKSVDADGNTVAEGRSALAEEAKRAATELAKKPKLRPSNRSLRR